MPGDPHRAGLNSPRGHHPHFAPPGTQRPGSLFAMSPTAHTHTRLFILGVLCCMGVPMGRQPGVIKITSTEAFKCSKTDKIFPVPGTLVCFLTPFQKWSHASPKGLLRLLFHFPEGILPIPWARRLGLHRAHVLLAVVESGPLRAVGAGRVVVTRPLAISCRKSS